MTREKAVEMVYAAIDAVNEQLSRDQKLEKRQDAILLGNGGKIDSVNFINLIVALEERYQQEVGQPVCLTAEIEAVDDDYPFRNVDTLANHLFRLSKTAA
jgi:acyl carrier protein